MKLKCVIVDDEPLAIASLESILKKIPNIEVVTTFSSAVSVLEKICEIDFDFLFLDIEMPNLTGIDFLKSLSQPPLAIITSANKNYALEGFELNVVDYLIKPLTFERVFKAVHKVTEIVAAKGHHNQSEFPDHLFLKENKKMVKINLSDILYIESIKDYVKVVTKEKSVVTKQNLSFFEKTLNPNEFLRIHRSFIIAIKHIDAYNCSSVEIGSTEIHIGRMYKDDAIKRLGDFTDSE
ncbi:MAG TPA: LytTR family DNA-binding domain-containing protein [Tenuifilaceae bacterium]|nr:LytTR family DNA-binding domain-containing protein [Tenuifilaceae bacterium]HPE18812.1 LytTR family DNA-binding domain-containing protein [Tenuifilaceae bacterium]HPJ46011.1 LytTR family DNA-binding domain-containing protein [Tenuifilaceae bacterium]HPQ34391.1 LytTR family DNA-binding domain-containing protein [Tenuifilaceae bacterium]HRX68551.1 LytTR family DNA-binding domain-containing protein [Tenuifilaceae bacterium]